MPKVMRALQAAPHEELKTEDKTPYKADQMGVVWVEERHVDELAGRGLLLLLDRKPWCVDVP